LNHEPDKNVLFDGIFLNIILFSHNLSFAIFPIFFLELFQNFKGCEKVEIVPDRLKNIFLEHQKFGPEFLSYFVKLDELVLEILLGCGSAAIWRLEICKK